MRYPNGMLGWADLSTPDPQAAIDFYTGLFGWVGTDVPTDVGNVYTMLSKDEALVAGMGQQPPEQQEAGVPPAWTCYALVGDVDEVVAATPGAGGDVVVPAFDVMTSGRMAVISDPAGAVLGLWQPQDHEGAELMGDPVSVTWYELQSRDMSASVPFYEEVFGWHWDRDHGGSEGVPYSIAHVGSTEAEADGLLPAFAGGTMTAGALPMPEDVPAEVPSRWVVYFAVVDCDLAVERAVEAGATLRFGPTSVPFGRFAALSDPQGAEFSVMAASQ